MTAAPAHQINKGSSKPLFELDASSIPTKEGKEKEILNKITRAFCVFCSHEYALRVSFFSFVESIMKRFTGQSVISLLTTQTASKVALKSSENIMNFSKGCIELF